MAAHSNEFCRAVYQLRQLHPEHRIMALYAANFWSEERLLAAGENGDAPGRPGEFAKPTAAVLQLVRAIE
jgi:hypothetical protein